MLDLSVTEKEKLIDEVIALTEKTNDDIFLDLNTTSKNLKTQLQEIPIGVSECEKINLLNEKTNTLLNDTVDFTNKLKAFIDNNNYS